MNQISVFQQLCKWQSETGRLLTFANSATMAVVGWNNKVGNQPTARGSNKEINKMQLINKQINLKYINGRLPWLGCQMHIWPGDSPTRETKNFGSGWRWKVKEGAALFVHSRSIARGNVYFCKICWAHIYTKYICKPRQRTPSSGIEPSCVTFRFRETFAHPPPFAPTPGLLRLRSKFVFGILASALNCFGT